LGNSLIILANDTNFAAVKQQSYGRFHRAKCLQRRTVDVLYQWREDGIKMDIIGLSLAKDFANALATFYYNTMLSIAWQGRVKEAQKFRPHYRTEMIGAEDKH
jgi:hypothetical protein